MTRPGGEEEERTTLEPLMSIDDVAATLRISERGVYRLISRGTLASLKVGGRTLLEPDEVRRFIAHQRRVTDGPSAHEEAA